MSIEEDVAFNKKWENYNRYLRVTLSLLVLSLGGVGVISVINSPIAYIVTGFLIGMLLVMLLVVIWTSTMVTSDAIVPTGHREIKFFLLLPLALVASFWAGMHFGPERPCKADRNYDTLLYNQRQMLQLETEATYTAMQSNVLLAEHSEILKKIYLQQKCESK